MKAILISLVFIGIMIISLVAYAVIPPLPEKEAIERSNVVIVGETLEVTKVGDTTDSGCMIRTPHEAKIKVLEIIKGTPKEVVTLHYSLNKLKERCVGQPFYGPFKGQKKKFYLRCKDDENCSATYGGMIEVEMKVEKIHQ